MATIVDSINDGVFTVDDAWRITSFNQAAEQITGISRSEAIGKRCCDVFRANVCETDCVLRKTLETGKPAVNKTVYIINAEGQRVPISISTAVLKEKGQTIGGVETFRDLSVVEELRKEVARRYTFEDIISKNHQMQKLFELLPQVATSDSTVLIEGESGTGKELFARAIHNLSTRRDGPFVVVNCGSLPDTLLESELFGYMAGAFTDAKKDKPGRFSLAKGGTIFLDEIGDVSPALQVRLLRVLQERTFEPLGCTEPVAADVRIVAATNKPLAELVDEGAFRQDLFYRINVVRMVLPPLRDRKEDIPLLVDHFVHRFNVLLGKNINDVSPKAMAVLANHNYRGNVRELENIIEHAFVLCPNGIIEPEYLPADMRLSSITATPSVETTDTFRAAEKQVILDALERNRWNRLATAKSLGIHKSTLFRKIKSLGIELSTNNRLVKV
ncbi:sigma-54 interaction domain-containing protein [Planctomycetota bacterium]